MSEKPKVGERWRFTGEGVVTAVWEITSEEPFVQIEIDKHCTWNIPLKNFPMERLPDPEPEWKPGDLAIDADGMVWQRCALRVGHEFEGDGWMTPGDGLPSRCQPHDLPPRPLRRLVIEGES